MNETDPQRPDLEEVRQAIASGDPVQAMPAITKLRHCSDSEAVPLLVLGTQQKPFLVRSLSCSGLGYKRTEQGWTVLSALITADEDPNVRAEAANALASYGVQRAWPLLRSAFEADAGPPGAAGKGAQQPRAGIRTAVASSSSSPRPHIVVALFDDLGYHVTRSAHDNLVTDANIESGDFISVVKRGITDRHTPHENRL